MEKNSINKNTIEKIDFDSEEPKISHENIKINKINKIKPVNNKINYSKLLSK